ncbi:MAG: ABC transporter permease [Oscillospiraceae bacterium]|nr:ABC transporter permease [Oscillospiraceae bacterium]
MENQKEIIIRPPHGWFDFDIKELWEYRDLVKEFVVRNFKLIYKQTVLGPAWLVLNPIITSVIFTFVFGQFAGISTDGVPQFLFYMAGNTLWSLFSTSITNNSNLFFANKQVFGKIYFPRLATPLSQSISCLINFFIQFAALLVFFVFYMFTGSPLKFSLRMLIIPVILVQTTLLALGVSLIFSALTAKYRDFTFIVTLGMQLWMYVSPVVYPMSLTGGWMYKILLINPMTPILNNFKWAFLGSGSFMLWSWLLSFVLTAVCLFAGIAVFGKVEKTFVDTV